MSARPDASGSLGDVQAFFARAIRQPVGVELQPDAASVTPRFVAGSGRLSPTSQLEIYREQFWLRHVGALEEDFATVLRLLGHDGFHALAERYLEAHPPTSFTLRNLGADMAAFLATRAPYCDDRLLADCARLEWAFVEAFDAADATPVTPDAIVAVPEEAWTGAKLRFHPAMQRVALGHAAHEYRAAVRAEVEAPRPLAKPVHVVVYRGPDNLMYLEIEPLAFDLLDRLARGEALGAACEAVAASAPDGHDLEAKVGGWFQLWAASGWLTAMNL